MRSCHHTAVFRVYLRLIFPFFAAVFQISGNLSKQNGRHAQAEGLPHGVRFQNSSLPDGYKCTRDHTNFLYSSRTYSG